MDEHRTERKINLPDTVILGLEFTMKFLFCLILHTNLSAVCVFVILSLTILCLFKTYNDTVAQNCIYNYIKMI